MSLKSSSIVNLGVEQSRLCNQTFSMMLTSTGAFGYNARLARKHIEMPNMIDHGGKIIFVETPKRSSNSPLTSEQSYCCRNHLDLLNRAPIVASQHLQPSYRPLAPCFTLVLCTLPLAEWETDCLLTFYETSIHNANKG